MADSAFLWLLYDHYRKIKNEFRDDLSDTVRYSRSLFPEVAFQPSSSLIIVENRPPQMTEEQARAAFKQMEENQRRAPILLKELFGIDSQ